MTVKHSGSTVSVVERKSIARVTADEIREVRNDPYTTNIIYDIKQKMLDLLATEACELGKLSDLMR